MSKDTQRRTPRARWLKKITCILFLSGIMFVPSRASAIKSSYVAEPGVSVSRRSGNMFAVCTLGFMVSNAIIPVGFLTAGHCYDPGAGQTNEAVLVNGPGGRGANIGHYVARAFKHNAKGTLVQDEALIMVNNTTVVDQQILGRMRIDGFLDAAQLRRFKPKNICKQGGTTGLTCGRWLWSDNQNVLFAAHGDRGDSGGPVFVPNKEGGVFAVGILSQGDGGDELKAHLIAPILKDNSLKLILG